MRRRLALALAAGAALLLLAAPAQGAVLAVAGLGAAIGGAAFYGTAYFATAIGIGWAIGSFIGNMLFAPEQSFQGPRLNDLQTSASTDGSPIPTAHGTVRLKGNVIWQIDIAETEHTEDVGGKGGLMGGGGTSTTWTYSHSFAVGFMDAPAGGIKGYRRVWADGKLIYSIADGADPATFAANVSRGRIAFYLGTSDQAPDPTIEAHAGAGNVPGFVNHAYMVFTNWQLADFGNKPIFVEAEAVVDGATSYPHWLHSTGETMSIHAIDTRRRVQYSVNHVLGGGDHIWRWDLTASAPTELYEFDSTLAAFLTDVSGMAIDEHQNQLVVFKHGLGHFRFARFELATGALIDSAQVNLTSEDLGGSPESVNTRDTWEYDYEQRWFVTLGDGASSANRYVITFVPNAGGVQLRVVAATSTLTWNRVRLVDANGDIWFCDGTFLINAGATAYAVTLPEAVDPLSPFIWKSRGEIWMARATDHATYGWVVFDIAAGTFADSVDLFGGNTWTADYVYGVESRTGAAWFFDVDVGGNVTGDLRDTAGAQLRYTDGDVQLSQHTTAITYIPGVVIFHMTAGLMGGFYEDALEPGTADLGDVVTAICSRVDLTEIDASQLVGEAVRGYVIARPMTARQALEPLQMAYAFDGAESDQVIKFVKRGGAAITPPVTASELGARREGESGEPPPLVQRTRAMETELPATLILRYFNQTTDYNIAAEYARRLTTTATNVIETELPLVMTSEEAAQLADNLMRQAWLERDRLTFTLPPSRRRIDPTDVLTMPDGTRARLVRTTYQPDGVIACEAVGDDLGMLTSYATGSVDEPAGAITLGARGPTQFEVLDIALLREADAAQDVCRYFAACGEAAEWPAGIVYQSRDGGLSWAGVAAISTASRIGVVVDGLLNTAVACGRFDHFSEITVQLVQPDLTLSSPASDAAFYQGANAFAISRDGQTWEIAQAYTVVSLGGARYTLRDFLRGRKGTEYAAGPFTPGARVVFLESGRISFAPASLTELDAASLWKGVTTRGNLVDELSREYTFAAVATTPLAPVRIGGAKQAASGDIQLGWTRRARINGAWRSGGAAPLDEPIERYELEFWTEGFGTLLRTESVEEATTFTYTAAMQTADFGGSQDFVQVRVYQLSDRVGRGFAGEAVVGAAPAPATFSSALTTTNMTLSTDLKTVMRAAVGAADFAPCSRTFDTGKWYWEVEASFAGTIGDFHAGITERTSFSTGGGIGSTDMRLWNTSKAFVSHISVTGTDLDYAIARTPTTLCFGWDAENGQLWAWIDGRYTSGTDPVAGLNPMATHTPSADWRPIVVSQVVGYAFDARASFGGGNRYPVPAGFTLIR